MFCAVYFRNQLFVAKMIPWFSKTWSNPQGFFFSYRSCGFWSRPAGGGASGGSLRSSRQAAAWHSFTRSWATMPRFWRCWFSMNY